MANTSNAKILKDNYPEVIREILEDYSRWLNKQGYIDSDYYTEEPKAVDAYLESIK